MRFCQGIGNRVEVISVTSPPLSPSPNSRLDNSFINVVWKGGNKIKEGSAPLLDAPLQKGYRCDVKQIEKKLRIRDFKYAIIFIFGAVVHSGERRVCIAKVGGSNPPGST